MGLATFWEAAEPLSGRSLHRRLLAIAGAGIAVALVVAWVIFSLLFERHAQRQLESDLARQGRALVAGLSLGPGEALGLTRTPSDPRFEVPASGLYWRLSCAGRELRSRSLWNGRLQGADEAPSTGWATSRQAGPFEHEVILVERTVAPEAKGCRVRVQVAADRAQLIRQRGAFAGDLGVFLAVLWAVLVAAAWAQVRLGLAPLRVLERALARMQMEPAARLEAGDHPVEVSALVAAINRLAEARSQDLGRARRRAQDLAHGLKTPLTALSLQTQGLEPERRKGFEASLTLLRKAVDGELARAKVLAASVEGGAAEARAVVDRLAPVLQRAHAGSGVRLVNRAGAGVQLPMSETAAFEVLGGLLENALRHARSSVTVSTQVTPDAVRIHILDDGPGIPAERREDALRRGVRLDETVNGQGLGLAIAADLVEAAGGRVVLGDAPGGGLAVGLVFPAAGAAQGGA